MSIPTTFYNFDPHIVSICKLCFEDITHDTFVLYKDQDNQDAIWLQCVYCSICVQDLLELQWSRYVEQIKSETCVIALKRLIDEGPPINFRDAKAVPCNNPRNEVCQFYFNNSIQSAKLKDSFVGEERMAWISELNNTLELLKFANND